MTGRNWLFGRWSSEVQLFWLGWDKIVQVVVLEIGRNREIELQAAVGGRGIGEGGLKSGGGADWN